MFQGNWTCSKCGGAITELPFEPKSDKGLTCRECFFKEKNGENAPANAAPTPESAPESVSETDDRDVPPFNPDAASAGEPAPDSPDRESAPQASGERPMFEGEWQCAGCGAPINKLPFQPRSTENLKCIDCFKNSKS